MRWKTRGEVGSTGSVRAMRGVVGIVLAVAATIAPNARAQNTQPQAAQDCESQRLSTKIRVFVDAIQFSGALLSLRDAYPDVVP